VARPICASDSRCLLDMEPEMAVLQNIGAIQEVMEVEMEKRMVVAPKRYHKVETEGEADITKKRKMELDVEETELDTKETVYRVDWDDSWWSCVDSDEEDREYVTDFNAYLARQYRESWDKYYSGSYGSFEAESELVDIFSALL
jgi:hypothetical protein